MTKEDWLSGCADPRMMFRLIECVASQRKKRLIAVACAMSKVSPDDDVLLGQLAEAERLADGDVEVPELGVSVKDIRSSYAKVGAGRMAFWTLSSRLHGRKCVDIMVGMDDAKTAVEVIREVIGNPWVSVRCGRTSSTNVFANELGGWHEHVEVPPGFILWENGLILKTAKAIYEANDWGVVPILGDMLDDARCDFEALAEHCRQAWHCRGCWVVDLLLGLR